MLARVATDAAGVTDNVAALVAVRATVATFDVSTNLGAGVSSPDQK